MERDDDMIPNMVFMTEKLYLRLMSRKKGKVYSELLPEFEFIDFYSENEDSELGQRNAYAYFVEKTERKDENITKTIPTMTYHLLRYSKDEYYFFFRTSHSFSDGTTGRSVLELISTLYSFPSYYKCLYFFQKYFCNKFLMINDSLNPDVCTKERIEKETEYWRDQLLGKQFNFDWEKILNLPMFSSCKNKENPRKSLNIYRFMEGESFKKFQNFIKRTKSTTFVCLTSLYSFYLHKLSGQKEFVVTYVANIRPRKLMKQGKVMTGCGINDLLLPVQFNDENMTIEMVIDQVKERRLRDREYCNVCMLYKDLTKLAKEGEEFTYRKLVTVFKTMMFEPYDGRYKFKGLESRGVLNEFIDHQNSIEVVFLYTIFEDRLLLCMEFQEKLFTKEKMGIFMDDFFEFIESEIDNSGEKWSDDNEYNMT